MSLHREPEWQPWIADAAAEETGISFDRTPAKSIRAPEGMLRVCAYHFDLDERPIAFADVNDRKEANLICDHLQEVCGKWNVDYVMVYDTSGQCVLNGMPGSNNA